MNGLGWIGDCACGHLTSGKQPTTAMAVNSEQSRNSTENPCDFRPHDPDGQEQDGQVVATCWRFVVIIETVELVALPNAPEWQEKVYRVHLDSGDSVDLFQTHWDVPLPPESLVGLTIEAARKMRI